MTVKLKDLEDKHYSTDLVFEAEGWKTPVYISITGRPTRAPSSRELENGWSEEEGMDHVEDAGVYKTALSIMSYLNSFNNDQENP